MARMTTAPLDSGNRFPGLSLRLIDGTVLDLPEGLGNVWGVLLIYRGHWCNFCRQQLTDFQHHVDEFAALGTVITAASVDDEKETSAFVDKLGLSFPTAWGLDCQRTASLFGSFFDGERKYLQPAGFLIRPDTTVELACYSSGPLGRLNAASTLTLIRDLLGK